MRIQHNIMAMSAYRNYTNNVSAMKKNLEKLSSGYKINRAGDDAAGLAISEKMRAQITGLETAQKNAKDGISLVQTAEGALTEVHDMLNRMVELATQSANGTYDNTTDRAQMQKEVNQLLDEINRIADSSNFNGINLLDGSLGLNKDAFAITSASFQAESPIAGLFGDPPTAGGTKITNTILHTEATKGVKGSFTLDFSQVVKKAAAGANATVDVKVGTLTQSIAAADATTDLDGKTIVSKLIGTGGALDGGLVIKADGTMIKGQGHTQAVGDALYTATNNNDGTVTFTLASVCTTAGAWDTVGNTDADLAKLAAIKDASVAAHKLNFDVSVTNNTTGAGALTGTENVAATNITATVKAEAGKLANFVLDIDVTKLQDGMKLKVGDKEVTVALGKDSAYKNEANKLDLTDMEAADLSGKKVDVLDRMSAALSGNGYFTVGQSANNKLTFSELADGAGTSTVATAKQDNLTSVDKIKALFSAKMPESNAKTNIKVTADELVEGNTLTVGDKKYVFTKDTTQIAPAGTTYIDINNAVNGLQAALTADGHNTTVNGDTVTITAAAKTDAAPTVLGKGLTLQIGDTADSYNQLNVAVQDMHAGSLGIKDLKINTEELAQAATDKIKAAINMVSDVRGTLGATQNRLDHTINNLSVMTENIQDAESTIRDVDVAEEMMAYTKNNILIQSAQAMLAQANQVPQGVLQLLG
jgi:flagellin